MEETTLRVKPQSMQMRQKNKKRRIKGVEASLVLFKRSLCVTVKEAVMDRYHVKREDKS